MSLYGLTDRLIALQLYTGWEWTMINERNNSYRIGSHKEYVVLTEDEADKRFNEWIKEKVGNYLDEHCPSNLRPYIDLEMFSNDFQQDYDYGSALASYDGDEHEIDIFSGQHKKTVMGILSEYYDEEIKEMQTDGKSDEFIENWLLENAESDGVINEQHFYIYRIN